MRLSVLATGAALCATGVACNGEPLTGPDAQEAYAEAAARLQAVPQDLLVFVDGEPLPPGQSLDDLDPRLIARIEVVKGAAARQIYGDAAARGVIRIYTTRKPASDTVAPR